MTSDRAGRTGPGKTPATGSVTPGRGTCAYCGGPLPPPSVGNWGRYCCGYCQIMAEEQQ